MEKSIVLTGFMGAGKSTAGELAAKKLNWEFIDIDLEIEKEIGMPTTEIFKRYGEKAFRTYEKNMIESKCSGKRQVLSLGGGAFMDEGTRTTCMEKTIVIFLDISWQAWKQRYESLIETRPILQERNLDEIKALFSERRLLYGNHHYKILTDNLTPDEVADEIAETHLKSLNTEK